MYVCINFLSFFFNARISLRLESHSLSERSTTQNISENLPTGARLHLIIQIPVLNILNEPENSEVVLRQKEYIYCLRRNLINPHVSLHCNLHNHENYNFLVCDWFKKVLFSTNSLARLLSESLLLDSLLSDSSISQSH